MRRIAADRKVGQRNFPITVEVGDFLELGFEKTLSPMGQDETEAHQLAIQRERCFIPAVPVVGLAQLDPAKHATHSN